MIYLSGHVRPDVAAMISLNQGGHVLASGQTWAADNGRFNAPHKYSDDKYLAWLARMPVASCLFATAPDVVGNAGATLALSAPLYGRIRALGYPVALVAQDGLENLTEFIPWDDFDVLFIGGTTGWKLSHHAAELVAEAKRRGKWVHMGRVNSLRRLAMADGIGCDSADGTYLKYGPDTNRPKLARWEAHIEREPSLWRPT